MIGRALSVALLVALPWATLALADETTAPVPTHALRGRVAAPALPDQLLIDQRGDVRSWHEDVLASRLIILQWIPASAGRDPAPGVSAFRELQAELGTDSDVVLVSVVADDGGRPADTPSLARRAGAGPAWILARQTPELVEALRPALGSPRDAAVLVGNTRTGLWTRLDGLDRGATLRDALDTLGNAAARRWFTDLPVIERSGRELRFYSDVLEGKIAVVDFIFTRCSGVCPMLSATMGGLQRRLGDLVGREVVLVSISIDPEHDSPAVLDGFARRFQAGPGWLFLTGSRQNIDWISYKLGAYNDEKEAHFAGFLVGDTLTGEWSKVVASASLDEFAALVRGLVDRREGSR